MKSKWFIIISAVILSCLSLQAYQPVIFLQDGGSIKDTIIDISSRNGMVQLKFNGKIHRSRIWMINYENNQWNFPYERKSLARNTDTVILRNNGVLHDRIVDFSSRMRRYEFARNGAVHESNVKRIYFCCSTLPPAYQKQSHGSGGQGGHGGHGGHGGNGGNVQSMTFLLTGRSVDSPLKYLNFRKTGFQSGLQINTKDIWMINLANDSYDFPRERRQLDRRLDTIFLSNGEVVYDTVTDYSDSRRTFRFENIDPIPANRIDRIYFCCTVIPDAYRHRRGNSRFRRR